MVVPCRHRGMRVCIPFPTVTLFSTLSRSALASPSLPRELPNRRHRAVPCRQMPDFLDRDCPLVIVCLTLDCHQHAEVNISPHLAHSAPVFCATRLALRD